MTRLRCGLVVLCLAGLSGLVGASEWPHLRGPNHDGRAAESAAFAGDALGLELAWRIPLGSGYSGIAVSGGRAVTLFSDGKSDWAVAVDAANGKELWRHRIDDTSKGHDGSDDGPLSSPVISDGVVYGLGPRGQLFALNLADGKPVWQRSLVQDFGSKAPHFGFTTSPLVEKDALIVQTGGSAGRAIVGLDKRSGKRLWALGDGSVDYQSPAVMELAGVRQLIAISGKRIQGLVPRTGKLLWEHELGENDAVESASPTHAGADRLLVVAGGEAIALRVTKQAKGYEIAELYRSKELGNTYALPVYHDGHLYGFRGQFLTCVDARNGERVWRSRPPGGRGLILVDGHLVVFGSEGNVVVAEATAEGYVEKARLGALDGSSLTWPSYAGGKVFVRNLESMASVAVVQSAHARETAGRAPETQHEFGRFVARLAASPRKQELLDAWLEQHTHSPIVEGEYLHFIYLGEAEDVAISGTMIASGIPEAMRRVEGTDLYHRSYRVEPGARFEYELNVDFDQRIPDPRNPRSVPAGFGDRRLSEVVLPGYPEAPHLEEPAGEARGTLDTFTFASELLGNEREITVYLPPRYAETQDAYPLLVVHDGKNWLEKGRMVHSLDNLIGGSVAPVVVAFVTPVAQWWLEAGGSGTEEYVRMLAEELVPHLEQRYRLMREPGGRALMGTTYFGATAAYAALKYPAVFGQAALQSVALGLGSDDALMRLIRERTDSGVRFYHDWNRYEAKNVDSAIDLHQDNLTLARALQDGGYDVAGGEVLDSFGWGGWPSRTDELLQVLFPAK